MGNIGCKIIKDFKRPSQELIDGFKGIPVANIDDCMNRTAAVDQGIKPYNKASVLGPAFTIKVPEGDNLMFHVAMDLAKPGDVIVIDAGGSMSRSIFGELMISYCAKRKLGGVIVDGCIRDVDTISKLDFPVYAKGVTPNGPYKNGPGEINTTVSIGGRSVCPGDIIVGDEDGIIIIKPENAEELLETAKEIVEKENKILETIENEGTYIRPWVEEKLKELNCEVIG